jgi:hypothetical protein
MKKLYKEYTLTAGGGTLTLKANALNDYYLINGGAVTLTSGLTIATDVASKNNVIRIYWLQDTTIGGGGSITILGNNVPINIIGGIMFTCVYNGTTWDVFQTPAENYDAAILELSNIAYVNYDITTDDTAKRVFKTYADAVSYISGLGTATTNNHWTIKLPSGYCDEAITLKAYIDVQGAAGTKIKSVVSNVAFVSDNVYDSVVYDCAIATAYVAEAKTANFVRCKFGSIRPVLGAAAGQVLLTDCTVKSADFSNSESIYDWSGNKFYATEGNILMSGITHNVKDSEIVAYGANNISLPDSMINCFISIPTITTTRATSIAGGKVVATTITAGADLNLLNTDIGAANLTMATATALVTSATKSSGTITLDGTATKATLDNAWNNGTASDLSATAWNNSTASAIDSTAFNQSDASGEGSVAMADADANGNYSIAGAGGQTDGSHSVAFNQNSIAIGENSFATTTGIATGNLSFASIGGVSIGLQSFAIQGGTSNGETSFSSQTGEANGDYSNASGIGVIANAYAEYAFGAYNTTEVPTSGTAWETADKLWSIGCGTGVGSEDDAIVMRKTGKATVYKEWTFAEAPIVGTSTEAAAEAHVGKIRYRSDASNSWCEMVMQTGAATWAWVVIKTNNW